MRFLISLIPVALWAALFPPLWWLGTNHTSLGNAVGVVIFLIGLREMTRDMS